MERIAPNPTTINMPDKMQAYDFECIRQLRYPSSLTQLPTKGDRM